MNTILLECGCSITRNMFGEHELVDFHLCEKHMKEYADTINIIFTEILNRKDEE